ncbi:MAG: hypothetical protein ACF8GE_02615 [Phycisphaerales bacterium JB043]
MLRSIAVGCVAILVTGCTSVSHSPRPRQAAGSTLPIEVRVSNTDATPSGWVHYRTSGQDEFQEQTLEPRGDTLWTMLPTSELLPDEWVEYYIDVDVDGSLRALGSPASPYVTVFLDEIGMILAGLHMRVFASDTASPVSVVVTSEYGGTGVPEIEYEVPGVPGLVRTTMTQNGFGRYEMVIPNRAVQPGTWRFVSHVPVGDGVYRIPEDGFSVVYVEEYLEEIPRHPRRRHGRDHVSRVDGDEGN